MGQPTHLPDLLLETVDGRSAIADFTIGGSPSLAIQLVANLGTTELFLLPTDATGRAIVGRGPEPVATIADPSIVNFFSDTGRIVRSLNVVSPKPGTTTLDVTWGSIHKTFTVQVTP